LKNKNYLKNTGKRLVVTEDVPKGTLLLAEKAYAIAFVTEQMPNSSQLICMIETVQKSKREPGTAKELYGLYAAGEGVEPNMPMPMEGVIDTGRIERICSLNCFESFDDRETNYVCFHLIFTLFFHIYREGQIKGFYEKET
jgi:hypothetical protein